MSELLLKGATMTNRHCENCGDPLFRHEGREFCPSCGWTPGEAVDADAAPADAGGGAAGSDADAGGGAAGSDADAGDGDAAAANGGAAETAAGGGPVAGPSAPQSGPQPGSADAGTAAGPAGSRAAVPADGEADLPAAREALARRVTALAREAEATRDVGRTHELLAAVREGAEALRALDGVGR